MTSRSSRQELSLSVDIGSSAVKVAAISRDGAVSAAAIRHYGTDSPRPGWVEQDPEQWWIAARAAIRECMAVVDEAGLQVEAMAFSGHMSAPVLVDGDGRPVMPAILIADARSAAETAWLKENYGADFEAMTGNVPIDAFTVSKLMWVAKHAPEALRAAKAMLFPKDYVRYRITGQLATDHTDAGNSLLYDAASGQWADRLIGELGLPRRLFPTLLRSHERAGSVSREAAVATGLPAGLPVMTGAADMACSQLGTGAVREGLLAVTLSTSGQVVMRVRDIIPAMTGKLTFHPSALPGTLYAMGTIFTGGLGVDWAYRLLSGKQRMSANDYDALGKLSEQMEGMAPGSGGLLFLPFLVGSGTPYFDARDRASWLGLATGQSREQLLHSVMEGVSYNIRESMELFEQAGYAPDLVHLGGGGSRNRAWTRMIGDVLGKPSARLLNRDASAAGAAMLAGVGSGWWPSVEAASAIVAAADEVREPDRGRHDAYNRIYAGYREVYGALNRYYRATAAAEGLPSGMDN